LGIKIAVAVIFVALAVWAYLIGEGQAAEALAIFIGFFVGIPIGSGLIIYRGLRLTRNFGDQKFGWLCVIVGSIVLAVYSLFMVGLALIDD
jgi:hypothetical protein